MPIADELHKLQQLRESGAIDDEEFEVAKARILRESSGTQWGPSGSAADQTRFWAMLLHFSLLAGYVAPLAGFIAPIVLWQVKKDELPEIDEHGKNATNWLISHLIYFVLCIPLCFVVIGFGLLMILGVLAIVFPVIAGIKANNGEVWRYPLSIRFF